MKNWEWNVVWKVTILSAFNCFVSDDLCCFIGRRVTDESCEEFRERVTTEFEDCPTVAYNCCMNYAIKQEQKINFEESIITMK